MRQFDAINASLLCALFQIADEDLLYYIYIYISAVFS